VVGHIVFLRQPRELAVLVSGEKKPDKDPNTALFRIDVIKGSGGSA